MFHSFLHRGCTGLVWPLIGLKCLRYSRGCTGFMFAFDLYTVVMLILIFMLSFIYVLYRFMCVHVYIYIYTYVHTCYHRHSSRELGHFLYRACVCWKYWRHEVTTMATRSHTAESGVSAPCCVYASLATFRDPPPKSPFIESSWSLIVGMWGILVGSWGVWAFSSINFGGDEKSPTRCSSGLRVEGNLRTRINHGATPLGRIISGELCP